MQVTIFGATGRTGRMLLPLALEAGHAVTVLVRDASRLPLQHDRLTALTGSVQDPAAVRSAVRGAEAVISVLGPVQNKPVYEISAATGCIIAAMQETGARRLIVTAGAGVRDPNDAPGGFDRVMGALVRLLARHVYEDMRRTVDEVRASQLDWTVVRVPVLVDAPRTGHVRVGYVGRGTGSRITRADVADFLLQQLTNQAHVRQAPAISN